MLNGRVETFETLPVECVIESLDGSTCSKVTAFTADKVTGESQIETSVLKVATFERFTISQIRV